MSVQYLVFDGSCSVCARIAYGIKKDAGSTLNAIDIHTPLAKQLLDRALPEGWDFSPYLIEISGEQVRAWTGPAMSLRFGQRFGLWRSMQAWKHIQRELGMKGAVMLSIAKPTTAFACDPCTYRWCGPCYGGYNTCDLRC